MVKNKRYFFVFILCLVIPLFMWTQTTFRNKLATSIVEMGFNRKIEVENHTLNALTQVNDVKELFTETSRIITKINVSEATISSPKSIKYILIWTLPKRDPLMYLKSGSEVFIERKCKVTNCYITNDKNMKQLTEFDVILFNGPEVVDKKKPVLPSQRSASQNYVFASIESSGYYPICDKKFDGYFNISWTYKLNSDIFYGYVIIRNSEGEIVGPKQEMHWMRVEDMKPINDTIKHKLSSKKKLAAWLVSNCNAPSGRDGFTRRIKRELQRLKSKMIVDIYGACGTFKCATKDMARCLQIFEDEYYFYLSFENSFSEDYVTEKIFHGLQHYAIPVVYGSANYSRFMPDGSYLNALELGPELLAQKMLEIIADKEVYYSYFKWMNHYSYHYVEETPETDFYCKFCEAMNDDRLMSRGTAIENFYAWWNPPQIRRGACPARL